MQVIIDGLTGQVSQLENVVGKLILDDNVKVDTPLTKQVLESSITHLLDILVWCSQKEADGICQIKGNLYASGRLPLWD